MVSHTMRNLMRAFALILAALVLVLLITPGSEAQSQTIEINEIQASNGTTIADGDGDFPDWIELRNLTSAPINLAGWQISDAAAAWSIPSGPQSVIPANGFLLIWASDKGDPADADFPGPAGELHTNFKLSSGGDSVTLRNNTTFAVEDTVTYTQPLGTDESYGRNDLGAFVVFSPVDVTPGAANGAVTPPTPTPTPTPTAGPAPASILINEVMQANTATIQDDGGVGNFEDWIELYNPTCASIDMAAWELRDSSESWPLPAGTILGPGELLFVWASNKGDPDDADFPGPAGELHTSFRLSAAAGEDLFLIDANGLMVATVNPGPSLPDESFGLTAAGTYTTLTGASISPNALNPGQVPTDCTVPTPTPTPTPIVPPTATPTPPATPTPTPTVVSPACSARVIINEVQSRNNSTISDGDGDFSDWIELLNPSTMPIDLSNWRVNDSGNTFRLPAGTTIGAGEFLLVWASDKGDPGDLGFPGPADEIHANFRLSGGGDLVALFDTTDCLIDQVVVPPLEQNTSYGVTLSGELGRFSFGFATPLAPNGAQAAPRVQTCYSVDSPMRINRIVARNDGLLADADGDDSDFLELRNTGFDPIDLTAWRIIDESDRWVIPVGTIVGGYDNLIIFASGKGDVLDPDYPGPAGELHASFKLSSSGERVVLAEPSDCIADQVNYPPLATNEAFGYDEQGQPAILVPGTSNAVCASPGSVQIAAVQAKNDTTLADEDGDFGDWIALRTSTDEAVDLGGWVLSDDFTLWVMPDGVTVEPGVDLIVWADEKNRGGADAAPHTNFKLSGDGESLTLGSSIECPVDALAFPALDDDQVYRLGADGLFAVEGASAPAEEADDDATDDDTPSASGDVVIVGTCIAINEIMAKNDVTLADNDGEFGDWIELVNLGDDPIDLSGFQLSDEETSWTIPNGVELDGGEFLIVWADEGDRTTEGELHTNFKLGAGGEPITLTTADGDVAASFSTYPELDDDEAFGVDADGNYVVSAAGAATPGEGPTVQGGCDFEVGAATAGAPDPGNDDEADGDDNDTSENGDAAADATADENAASDDSDGDLAITGSNTRTQTFAAQLLVFVGLALVMIARITQRRNDAN